MSFASRYADPLRFVFPFVLVLILLAGQSVWGNVPVSAAPGERFLAASTPAVSLNIPAYAFIGENVNFTVTFDNPDPTDPGYGPLIDLIIPRNGADGEQNTNPPLDGLSFVNATYLGVDVARTVLTFPGSGGVTCVDHPYMVDNTGSPAQVCGDAGDTFVALRLPFGSFTPAQPPLVVTITASMSNLADLNIPLTIRARGGYQFGYTPLDDWCCGDDPSLTLSNWISGSVTPTLFTLSKTYNGPEDETAAGPNFPRLYTVTAQIAPGQTMTSFNLSDVLPNNMQFVRLVSPSPGEASCTLPSTTTPGGALSCNFTSVSGTATMTFEYYIPLRDGSSDSVIDPSSGDDVTSCNNASGGGTWAPSDIRDTGGTFTRDPDGCEHTLNNRSIAIQKNVSVVGGGQPFPGKYLEYTLDFQISDFFAFNHVVITDTISDGQRFDPTFVPTLEINGNTYTLDAAAMAASNVTISCNYTGATASPPAPPGECDSLDPATDDGSTTIIFNVSQEITARGQDGRLIGGCVPTGGTGGDDPDCGSYNDGPTTGRIVFRTLIQQDFTDNYPSGDPSVDQGDRLDNAVMIDGIVLSTVDASTPTEYDEGDDSTDASVIGRGVLTKAIYAVNGSTSFPTPVEVKPGDTVTYRLTYTLPTGDVEDLAFNDYLPLPVFHVGDPDENGADGPAWTFDRTVSDAAPPAGFAKFGPADTFYAYSAIVPTIASNTTNNRLNFFYGDFDGTTEQPYTVDILFTVTVSDDPFADRLYLTNQAHAYEGSTNAGAADANAIAQIILTQPVLRMQKGIIWAENDAAIFNPTPPGPVTFLNPTNSPRWSGTINSANLASTPINSNVSGLDAGDLVTFAIVIENTGSSGNGAFDIRIRDDLPASFVIPDGGLNLQVHRGNGTALGYTDLGGGLFGAGIEIVDPGAAEGACQPYDPNNGRNIVLVTFDLELAATVGSGQHITNTATLFNYAGSEGGPDHTANDLTDTARVTTRHSSLGKTFTTEINNSDNGLTQAVIGEFVDYTLTITIPEGRLPNVTLEDNLPSGLAFVDCLSITPSSGGLPTTDLSTDLVGGFAAACNDPANPNVSASGQNFTFTLGAITNDNRDNTADETLTIVFRAVVLNVSGNQTGTTRHNSATLRIDGGAGGTATVQSATLTVIEPAITTVKSVVPSNTDAGDTVTFTVTLTNPASGSTTAYDVTWSDTIPPELTYSSGTLTGSCATHLLTLSDADAPTLSGSVSQLDPGETCTIAFDATVNYSVTPGQVITNTAETRWTSLPGAVADRSPYNTDSDERDGTGGLLGSGALNDYRTQGQAAVTINNVALNKYLLVTSEAHTGAVGGTERVVIGEIVRYRLVVQLPEGASVNFQIQDQLPNGLTYLDDGTARLALLSDDSPIASTEPPGSTLGLALGSGPFGSGPWVHGNDPAPVTPTYILPDQNVGSSDSLTLDPDSYGNGSNPYFKLGTLTNNDSDADGEYIIIEFNALVNNAAAGSNDAGDNRDNNFRVFINNTQNGSTSNNVRVRIAEPLLSLAKTVATAPVDAGDIIVYTLTISAASGDDRSTAFDLVLTDTFDPYLTGLSVANVTTSQDATCAGNGSGTASFSHNGGSFTSDTLTFTATCLDPGRAITITVSGTIAADAPAGYLIPNTGNLTYTSLPDSTGTIVNPTGSSTPGAPGSDAGERDGSGAPAHNDYFASGSANTPLAAPQIVKQAPTPTGYPIGATVAFPIAITLPEGVTRNVRVTDAIPTGMQYVSYSVDTSAFSGSVPVPTVSGGASNGDDVLFSFGDITTTDENNPANNTFTLLVTLRVLDVPGNQIGAILTNGASLTYTPGAGSTDTTLSGGAQNITVIEPRIVTAKSVVPTSDVQAGNTLTYTVHFTNTGTSTAYDVAARDILAQGVTYNNDATCVFYDGASTSTIPVTVTVGGGTLTFDGNPAGAWDIPAADPDSYIECTYTATAQSSLHLDGAHTNTVDADWTSLNGPNANERVYDDSVPRAVDGTQDTASATFTSSAPTFDKSDAAMTLPIGATYTVTLTITSPLGTLRNLTITDALPAGLFYVSGTQSVSSGVSPAPTFAVGGPNDGSAPTTLTWTFGDTAVSSSPVTITYNVTVANVFGNQNGVPRTNNAALTYDDAQGNPKSLTDSTTVTVVEPELNITKTVDNATPGGSQTFTYTLTIQHLISSTAHAFDLSISDNLPESVEVSLPPTVSDAPGGCAGTVTDRSAGNNISLTIASLPLGCVLTVQYQAVIVSPPTIPGEVVANTANLTWASLTGVDPYKRDGSGGVNDYADSDGQNVTFTAVDLQITKDDGGVTVNAGDTVPYTLAYTNAGNSVASGVVITETVPANTTFNAGASTPGWSCADGSPAGTTCTLALGALDPADSGSVVFAVTVDNPLPAGVTQIANTASIADGGAQGSDANPADNSDDDETPVTAAPDLTITKDDGFTVVSPGQTITYTLTIANVGTQGAAGVVVTDTLPANTTFVSASNGGTYNSATGVVTWPSFDLAASAPAVTRTVTIQVNDPFPGASMLNQAHVRDDGSNGPDLTPDNNDDDDTDAVLTLPNSDLTKSLLATNQGFTADPSVAIGEILTYEIVFTVPAGGTMPNLTLTDTLDRGLAFVDCLSITPSSPDIITTLAGDFAAACNDPTNPTIWTEPPGSDNPADPGRRVTFTLGDVSNTGSSDGAVTVQYRVVVLDTIENQDSVTLNNSASLTWASGSLAASAPNVSIVEPDFALSKTANRTVAPPGSVITFTLTSRHTAQSNVDAFDVVLTDVLPTGLTYVPGSLTIVSGPPGGTTDDTAAPTLRVRWPTFPLLTGGSRTEAIVQFQAILGNLSPGQRVSNTAALEWTSLPGDISAPQSPYNNTSTERYYDPGSEVNIYGVQTQLVISTPALPATGFAPGRVTILPPRPLDRQFTALGSLRLEIPKLGLNVPIVGVPLRTSGWDLTWLSNQAGWLEGTAFPTWKGNSALTAHVYLANGLPGPFFNLHTLFWGDRIIIHLGRQQYLYEVRQVRRVWPDDLSVLRHEEYPWLTLITCRDYNEHTESYRYRIVVRAVQVKIQTGE